MFIKRLRILKGSAVLVSMLGVLANTLPAHASDSSYLVKSRFYCSFDKGARGDATENTTKFLIASLEKSSKPGLHVVVSQSYDESIHHTGLSLPNIAESKLDSQDPNYIQYGLYESRTGWPFSKVDYRSFLRVNIANPLDSEIVSDFISMGVKISKPIQCRDVFGQLKGTFISTHDTVGIGSVAHNYLETIEEARQDSKNIPSNSDVPATTGPKQGPAATAAE